MPDRLAEIRERWAQAAAGPWERMPGTPVVKTVNGRPSMDESELSPAICMPGRLLDANAEAIAHAPADVDYLLKVADAARKMVEELPPIGVYYGACIYCGEDHAPDCPWLRLRGLLEGEPRAV